MRKLLLSLLVISALLLSIVPGVLAADFGIGVGVDIITEDFAPIVWQCDHRIVYDDNTEPGRVGVEECVRKIPGQGPVCFNEYKDQVSCESDPYCEWKTAELVERINNYAFEGEQIQWKVLVMDKNGIDKVADVHVILDEGIEANCERINDWPRDGADLLDDCNARILEEELEDFDSSTMSYYWCTLTVETPESMYDEYYVTVEAEDVDGLLGTMDETEYWFLNPSISLDVQGALVFDEVRPGTSSYSDTLLVGNDADDGSGVLLDMFISGTDFYDSSNSGAKCPTTNQLGLGSFRYYATSGAYSTHDDTEVDLEDGDRNVDAEGYVNIDYGIGFNNPNPFYDNMEIIQSSTKLGGVYYAGNVLSPGAEMALTFRLDLPEPCNGDFDTGQIFFWGEAI